MLIVRGKRGMSGDGKAHRGRLRNHPSQRRRWASGGGVKSHLRGKYKQLGKYQGGQRTQRL